MTTDEIIDSTVINTVIGKISTTTSKIKNEGAVKEQNSAINSSSEKPINTIQKEKKVHTFTPKPIVDYTGAIIAATVVMIILVIFVCAHAEHADDNW